MRKHRMRLLALAFALILAVGLGACAKKAGSRAIPPSPTPSPALSPASREAASERPPEHESEEAESSETEASATAEAEALMKLRLNVPQGFVEQNRPDMRSWAAPDYPKDPANFNVVYQASEVSEEQFGAVKADELKRSIEDACVNMGLDVSVRIESFEDQTIDSNAAKKMLSVTRINGRNFRQIAYLIHRDGLYTVTFTLPEGSAWEADFARSAQSIHFED